MFSAENHMPGGLPSCLLLEKVQSCVGLAFLPSLCRLLCGVSLGNEILTEEVEKEPRATTQI